MKIHEYQAKELLRAAGVPVPRGYPAFTVREAKEAAQKLGGSVWVVKAQIHAGGRGKGGGVKLARALGEVEQIAGQILGMQLKTHQTGPEGQKVRRLLVEEGADIKKEYYVAALTDRATQSVALMASSEGGMDIEEVAHKTPEKIIKVFVDPLAGLTDAQALELARGIGVPQASQAEAMDVFRKLYACYMDTDASLAEINPLILEGSGHIKALDAKFNFDANALFRHPEIVAYRDLDEEDPAEVEASKFDLSYISLDGNIGQRLILADFVMDRRRKITQRQALAVELVEQHEGAGITGNHIHQPARLRQTGLFDQVLLEQAQCAFQLADVFLLLRQALLVQRIALHQMILEDAVGPDTEAGAFRRFDAVADGNDHIEVVMLDRFIRICNVQILHIAFFGQFILLEHVAQVFGDDRTLTTKQAPDLILC